MDRRDDAKGLYDRGNALLALKRHDEALACYDKALAIRPDYLAALHNRGLALRSLKRHAEALASHDRALAISPNDAQGLYVRGNALCALSRYDQALISYDKALAIHPNYVEALHNRGIALRNLDRPLEALASHDRALAIRPNDGEGLYNRGNALLALKRLDEALVSYDKALAIHPNHVEALHRRGIIALRNLNRPAEALSSHDRALAIRPDHAEGHYNRGLVLFVLKRFEEALAAYDKAMALDPNYAEALYSRGNVLRTLKRPKEAIDSYRRALDNGADPEEIEYLLAGLGAASSPVAAPRKFVTELFDQSADRFEEHLVGTLKYQGPTLIFDGIARLASTGSTPTGNLDILDLGCGTGLVGARFRPLARTLTGVDLSRNMLEEARKRQIYDQLVCMDLTEFLQARAGQFDLVVAGDVFVYIGDLSKVFQGVGCALRSGGLFGFSVEANDAQDFTLETTLRYAHSVGYLQKLANDNRLAVESIEPVVIRQQEGVDVNGCVFIMRAPV